MEYLQKYFSLPFIQRERETLLEFIKGKINDAKICSELVHRFITEDTKFKEAITKLFDECPMNQIFGHFLINTLALCVANVEGDYIEFLRGKSQYVICESDGWLYLSIEDNDVPAILPDKIKWECVSYAKIWKGNIQF